MLRSLAFAFMSFLLVACSETVVREGTPVDRSLLAGHQGRWETCINEGEESLGVELTISGNVITSQSFRYMDSACRINKTPDTASSVTVMEYSGTLYFEANGEYWDLTLTPSTIVTDSTTYTRV